MDSWESPRRRFAALVDRPDDDIPLAEAAASIALIAYPELPVDAVVAQLESLAARAQARVGLTRSPVALRAALERVLYGELGLTGNDADYYDPRNSFLNDVLERRLGIPISLSVIYLTVARSLGLEADGIGFPGHFLLRVRVGPAEHVVVDAYAGGRDVGEADLRALLSRIAGRDVPVRPAYLVPSSARDILARMLGNLRGIYAGRGDAMKTLETMEWLVLTRPLNLELKRDRGLLYYRLGSMSAAVDDLTTYLRGEPEAEDRPAIERLIEKASAATLAVN